MPRLGGKLHDTRIWPSKLDIKNMRDSYYYPTDLALGHHLGIKQTVLRWCKEISCYVEAQRRISHIPYTRTPRLPLSCHTQPVTEYQFMSLHSTSKCSDRTWIASYWSCCAPVAIIVHGVADMYIRFGTYSVGGNLESFAVGQDRISIFEE